MKKVLVSGYIGFNNFGDEAIFYALSNHLKKNNFKVSVLCTNTKETQKKYDVDTYYYKSPAAILNAIIKNDILISGGGSLLQNKTSNFSLFYYLFIILISKLLSKKVIIFAQGIEPIKGKINEFVFKNIIKSSDFVTVRDYRSKLYLEKLNIKSHLVSDPIYSLLEEKNISQNKEGLIVQLRATKQINNDFIKNLAFQISKNFKNRISVLSLQDTYDTEVCIQLIKELKLLGVESKLISNESISDTIESINNAEFMISTRLHGAIAAHALKTKIFTLNYDEKLKTLTDELNIPCIDLERYSYDSLNEKLDIFFNSKADYEEYRKFNWQEIDSKLNTF